MEPVGVKVLSVFSTGHRNKTSEEHLLQTIVSL